MKFFSKLKEDVKYDDKSIVAIADATVVPTDKINDPVFSKEMLGQTIAFELKEDIIVSPSNGILEVMYPTGHAFAVRRNDGLGILVHVGINTVDLNGKGFKIYAKQGAKVKAGQKILKIDSEFIKKSGYDLTTMLIITENHKEKLQFLCQSEVKSGQIISKN